jgi:hypothetical protein
VWRLQHSNFFVLGVVDLGVARLLIRDVVWHTSFQQRSRKYLFKLAEL